MGHSMFGLTREVRNQMPLFRRERGDWPGVDASQQRQGQRRVGFSGGYQITAGRASSCPHAPIGSYPKGHTERLSSGCDWVGVPFGPSQWSSTAVLYTITFSQTSSALFPVSSTATTDSLRHHITARIPQMFRSAVAKSVLRASARPSTSAAAAVSRVAARPALARGYHEKVISHYEKPRNVRRPPSSLFPALLSDNLSMACTHRLAHYPRLTRTLGPVLSAHLREYIFLAEGAAFSRV